MNLLDFLQKFFVPYQVTGTPSIGNHCITLEHRIVVSVNADMGGFSLTPLLILLCGMVLLLSLLVTPRQTNPNALLYPGFLSAALDRLAFLFFSWPYFFLSLHLLSACPGFPQYKHNLLVKISKHDCFTTLFFGF